LLKRWRSRLLASLAVTAAATLGVISPPAGAHVTAQPAELPADEFVRVTFRVPNERPVPTTRLEVQLPPELDSVRVQPVTGWRYKITRKKLPRPREVFGERVSEYVSKIEWTGRRIGVDEFQEFPVSVKLPKEGTFGEYIAFPALQTYSNGEVVRWIQRPETPTGSWDDLEEPAAHLRLQTAEELDLATTTELDDDVGSNRTLTIIALVVGGIALLLGLVAAARRARRT
jgi:uncharacterized protein YcnI